MLARYRPTIRRIANVTTAATALLCMRVVVAQTPPSPPPPTARELTLASVAELYRAVEAEYLDGTRPPNAEAEALRRGRELLAIGLNPDSAIVAAVQLYRTMDLASRLPTQRLLLRQAADSAYAYVLPKGQHQQACLFLLSVGTLELNRGDYAAGIVYIDSARTAFGGAIARQDEASAMLMRGYCAEGLGDVEEAHANFQASAALYGFLPDVGSRGPALSALEAAAGTAMDLGRYPEALALSTRALEQLYEQQAHTQKLPAEAYSLYLSHAEALVLNGRGEEGFAYGKLALQLAEDRQDVRRIASAKWHLGRTYRSVGDFVQAERYLAEAVESMATYGFRRLREEALEDFVTLRERQGRYADALALQTARYDLRDSLDRETQVFKIEELRALNEERAAEHRLAIAAAEQQLQDAEVARGRAYAIGLSAALLALVGLVTVLVGRLRRRTEDKDRLEALVKQRTRSLSRQAEELRRSNVELERFAHVASHDLKTPVRNVTSFIQLAERRLDAAAQPEVAEYLDMAGTYAQQMGNIVGGIAEFSEIDRQGASRTEDVDLRGLVKHVTLARAESVRQCGAAVATVGGARVQADAGRVRRIIDVLLDNALTYTTAPFPRVTIAVAQSADGGATISVRDNGIGIAPAYHEKIFGMFTRLHTLDEYPGTGLGLATASKLAERLGGTLTVSSALGDGSTFVLGLPAGGAAGGDGTARSSSSAVTASGR